jgi:hypothetical protein
MPYMQSLELGIFVEWVLMLLMNLEQEESSNN